MKIIFAHALIKKERISLKEIGWLLKAYRKGISQEIQGKGLPKESKLIKLYMTTIIGTHRAVFLVDLGTGDTFFLMFRSKKDPIGENITIKNPKFQQILSKYLSLLREELRDKNFDIYIL